jgi:phytoene/squalene synthetase
LIQEPSSDALTLDKAYAACRAIARREAKNFYYSFVALPKPRRNAICAIYAFMRQADDLADNESLSRDERRRRLDAWLAQWRAVCESPISSNPATADPVFLAVRDCTTRFHIPLSLLDELVSGVTMDLDRAATESVPNDEPKRPNLQNASTRVGESHSESHEPGSAETLRAPSFRLFPGERVGSQSPHSASVILNDPERTGVPGERSLLAGVGSAAESKDLRLLLGERVGNHTADTYATFADLYRYCYLVASVVGLVCIHIFGYSDPRAEKLAEETGIAFQLTNILRDVAEDAQRNRVYLPLEDLAAHNVSLDSLLHRAPAAPLTASERALLASIAQRAEDFYKSAQELLPLIDRESRPALWVLVSIYHGLLKRIERADYDVFSSRASVPTPQKLGILAVGMARMGLARLLS